MARCKICGLAVVIVLALSALAAQGAEVNRLAQWIPADSLAFIAYDGNNAAARQTALGDILSEPEVKAVLDGPLAAVGKFLSEEALKKAGLTMDVLMPILQTRIGIAAVGIAPPAGEGMPPQPEALLIIEVGKPDSPAAKAAGLLLDRMLAQAGVGPDALKDGKVGDIPVRTAHLGMASITCGTVGDHFILGVAEGFAKAVDAHTTKLAEMKEFKRVTEMTGGNEVFLLHYNHSGLMAKLGMFMPPDVGRVLLNKDFGLANVRSVTIGLAPDGKGLRGSIFINAPGERRGLLKILGGKPLDTAILKLVPKDPGFVYACSLDPGELWDFILQIIPTPAEKQEAEQKIAEANKEVGFDIRADLVGSVGDEFAVFGPDFISAVRLKNPDKFKSCLEKLLSKLGEKIAETGGEMKGARLALNTMTYKQHTIAYVDSRRVPLFFQPCYTIVGDYAVFAIYPMMLKTYLDERAGNAGTIMDNADFVAVRTKMGAGASSIYYANTKDFLADVYSWTPFLMGLLKMVPEEFQGMCPDPAKLPPASVIAKHLFGCTASCRPLEDGILWESYSPVGVPTPPVIKSAGGGVFTIAVLAGMLMPALAKARGEARKVMSKSNLAQIARANQMWLVAKGDNTFYPPSMKTLLDDKMIEDPRVFLHPKNRDKPRPEGFITDYDSTLDRAGFKLKESDVKKPGETPLAWEKRRFSGDGRNVVFFDSHVEFIVSEDYFRQLMKKVDEVIAEAKKEREKEKK